MNNFNISDVNAGRLSVYILPVYIPMQRHYTTTNGP